MSTTARRCAGCGGPLSAADARQIRCPFCGVVNELSHQGPQSPPPTIHVNLDVGQAVGHAARFGRTLLWVTLLIAVLVVVIAGVAIRTAIGPVSDAVRSAVSPGGAAPASPTARSRTYAPGDIRNAGQAGWLELVVPSPPTGWTAFEPVANVEWATAIARAWEMDAVLTRIDINRVMPAGTVDLTLGPDNSAGYRFVSPSQIEEWRRTAERDSNAQSPYELMLKLTQQKVTALVVRGRPPSVEMPPGRIDSRPLPDLLARALTKRGFTEHPFYNGYLIALEREGWVWYMQPLSERSALPRVRARDGAVYPYR